MRKSFVYLFQTHLLKETEQFFTIYKELEEKKLEVGVGFFAFAE